MLKKLLAVLINDFSCSQSEQDKLVQVDVGETPKSHPNGQCHMTHSDHLIKETSPNRAKDWRL